MTKQQLLHASKLFMELSGLFKLASEQQDEVETIVTDVIQPLVPVVEEPVTTEVVEDVVEEQDGDLNSKTVQQLRSLAKSLGLSTKGTKKDLIARISDSESVEEEEIEETEEVIEEVVPEVVEVEDEEETEEEEPTEELSQMELIQVELESMETSELVDILGSVELPTKGKRQALISRIMDAVAEGVIEFETEEVEEYDADEDVELDEAIEQTLEDDSEEEEIEETEENEEEIEVEENEEDEELSPREATQIQIEEEIMESYENGSLTDKQIAKFLEEYFNGKFKPINKKRALNKYIEIQCDLVDEEGDRMEMGEPYYVNDEEIFCCGSSIKELDNGNLFCEVCGQEYETE